MFSLIVAKDLNGGIGKNNKIPWRIKKDIEFFKFITMSKDTNDLMEVEKKFKLRSSPSKKPKFADKRNKQLKEPNVYMGRKTWDSIPIKYRPLVNRKNCIISRKSDVYNSMDGVYDCIKNNDTLNFIIGGSEIYKQSIQNSMCKTIYVTKVHFKSESDVFFPEIPLDFELNGISDCFSDDNDMVFNFMRWDRT